LAEVTTLREAVAEMVEGGDTVALEGFTHLIPTAAAHEVIRQERRNLTLIRMTPDLIYDQIPGWDARRSLSSPGGTTRGSVPCTASATPRSMAGRSLWRSRSIATLAWQTATWPEPSPRPTSLHRGRRSGRGRRLGGLCARDLQLLAAGRPRGRGLPRWRPDRPLRQNQHHRHRFLRRAESAPARRRGSARDRRFG
jgi:hypothetical protein